MYLAFKIHLAKKNWESTSELCVDTGDHQQRKTMPSALHRRQRQ